ncbi:MAG TPA: hypothetical protein VEB39_02385 [Sphingomicrobium sp.]|nr:hypothetical protein [Sphingomicrobium sp.]
MRLHLCALLCAIAILPACKTASKAADGVKSAGSAVAEGAANVTTSLVNVDLSNVLNDVAVKLNIDKSNIPINAQIPISIAANVCGVSINILSIGAGGGSSKGCTAQTASPELVQAVQQQLAAQGNVGGGAQTNTGTSGTTTTTQPTTTTTQPTTTTTQPTQPEPQDPPQ